jgi:peroxiredoxin
MKADKQKRMIRHEGLKNVTFIRGYTKNRLG